MQAQSECATEEGVLLCPEGAATVAALRQELKTGRIKTDEQVLLFNCATGLKYEMPSDHQKINLMEGVDYKAISQS